MATDIIIVPSNEQLTMSTVVDVARRDYSEFVTGNLSVDQFVRDNCFAYYTVINTWILLCQDLGGSVLSSLLSFRIMHKGLKDTISVAASYADFLIAKMIDESAEFSLQLPYDSFLEEAGRLEFRKARQVLNYAKRFAPVVKPKYSALRQLTLDSFLSVNQENLEVAQRLHSLVEQRPSSNTRDFTHKAVLAIARHILRDVLKVPPKMPEGKFPRFGPGAVRNCTNTPYHKYEYLVENGAYAPFHQINLFPLRPIHPDLEIKTRISRAGKKVQANLFRPRLGGIGRFPQVTRWTTVPKSYKTDRGIAMEDPCNMSLQLQLMDQVLASIESSRYGRYMPIRDQSVNRYLAREAALTGSLATLDLSHASDSVTKQLVQLLFPDCWWRAFARCIPFGFILKESDQGPRKLNCFATMGCGCTFVVETLVFYSLQLACYLWAAFKARSLTLRDIRDYNFVVPPTITSMGDDCICPTKLAEFISREFSFFGFKVNDDKSFVTGPYRESCGAEWLKTPDGVLDVTTVYWPRIPIRRNLDQFLDEMISTWDPAKQEMSPSTADSRLIALQHRLYDISPAASRFLFDLIRSHQPGMTASRPDEGYNDLWSPEGGGITAVYVSGSVPPLLRLTPAGRLPDGYLLIENLKGFIPLADNYQLEHLRHASFCIRELHLECRVRSVPVDAREIRPSLLAEFRYESFLHSRKPVTGFPFILNGFQPDVRVSLAQVSGFGASPVRDAECIGKYVAARCYV